MLVNGTLVSLCGLSTETDGLKGKVCGVISDMPGCGAFYIVDVDLPDDIRAVYNYNCIAIPACCLYVLPDNDTLLL